MRKMKDYIRQLTSTKGTGIAVNVILILIATLLGYFMFHSPNSKQDSTTVSKSSSRSKSTQKFEVVDLAKTRMRVQNASQYEVISEKNLFSSTRTAPGDQSAEELAAAQMPEKPPDINLVGILFSTSVKRAYVRDKNKDAAFGINEEIGESGFVIESIHLEKIVVIPKAAFENIAKENEKAKESDKEETAENNKINIPRFEIFMKQSAGAQSGAPGTMASAGSKMFVEGDYSDKKIEMKEVNGELRPFVQHSVRGRQFPRYLTPINTPISYEEVDGKMVAFTNKTVNGQTLKVRETEVSQSAFTGSSSGSSSSSSSTRGTQPPPAFGGENNPNLSPNQTGQQMCGATQDPQGMSGGDTAAEP
jgi:hypothetical protein